MSLPCLHSMKPTFFFFATPAIKLHNKFKKNSKRSRINVRSFPIRVLLFLILEKNWKIQWLWLSVHPQLIHQVALRQLTSLIISRKSKFMQCYSILHQISQAKVGNFCFQSDIRGHPHMMWHHWCHGKIEFFSNPHHPCIVP